jgi:hypothetical protein
VEASGGALVQPEQWLAAQTAHQEALEATMPDGIPRVLLLPAGLSPRAALELLIGDREDADLPWHTRIWLETQDACWIRREAIIALRIVPGPASTSGTSTRTA